MALLVSFVSDVYLSTGADIKYIGSAFHLIILLLPCGRIGGSNPIPTAPKTDGPKRLSVSFLQDSQFLEFFGKPCRSN